MTVFLTIGAFFVTILFMFFGGGIMDLILGTEQIESWLLIIAGLLGSLLVVGGMILSDVKEIHKMLKDKKDDFEK